MRVSSSRVRDLIAQLFPFRALTTPEIVRISIERLAKRHMLGHGLSKFSLKTTVSIHSIRHKVLVLLLIIDFIRSRAQALLVMSFKSAHFLLPVSVRIKSLLRIHLLLDWIMERSLTWTHFSNALFFLHLFFFEQTLEELWLGLKHIDLINWLLLEIFKHLDLSVEGLGNGDIPAQLLALIL